MSSAASTTETAEYPSATGVFGCIFDAGLAEGVLGRAVASVGINSPGTASNCEEEVRVLKPLIFPSDGLRLEADAGDFAAFWDSERFDVGGDCRLF